MSDFKSPVTKVKRGGHGWINCNLATRPFEVEAVKICNPNLIGVSEPLFVKTFTYVHLVSLCFTMFHYVSGLPGPSSAYLRSCLLLLHLLGPWMAPWRFTSPMPCRWRSRAVPRSEAEIGWMTWLWVCWRSAITTVVYQYDRSVEENLMS